MSVTLISKNQESLILQVKIPLGKTMPEGEGWRRFINRRNQAIQGKYTEN